MNFNYHLNLSQIPDVPVSFAQLYCVTSHMPRSDWSIFQTHIVNEIVKRLTEKFRVKHYRSIPYRPQANGLVERFNKSLCNSLAKLVDESAEWDIFVELAL